jgi:hypothetical protein
MTVIFQVHHSKEFGDVANGKNFVLSSLFEIDPYRLEIEDSKKMIYWLSEFTKQIKSKIGYNEIIALSRFNPVLQVSAEYVCLITNETKHYKMDALLHHVYPLNSVQIEELGTDLFVALAEKWLLLHRECEEVSQGEKDDS